MECGGTDLSYFQHKQGLHCPKNTKKFKDKTVTKSKRSLSPPVRKEPNFLRHFFVVVVVQSSLFVGWQLILERNFFVFVSIFLFVFVFLVVVVLSSWREEKKSFFNGPKNVVMSMITN